MYQMEPLSDGRAFREYVVLNSALGDLDMENCRPLGTLKSKMAETVSHEHRCTAFVISHAHHSTTG